MPSKIISVQKSREVSALLVVPNSCIIAGGTTFPQGPDDDLYLVDISGLSVGFRELNDRMQKLGEELGMVIHVMHEDIFNSMHRI